MYFSDKLCGKITRRVPARCKNATEPFLSYSRAVDYSVLYSWRDSTSITNDDI